MFVELFTRRAFSPFRALASLWFLSTLLFILGGVLSKPASGLAGEVELRLVAADAPGSPDVDSLVNFRRAADGGLIATAWLSGLTLGDQPLFPVLNRGALAPDAPDVVAPNTTARSKLLDEDDLLGDIKKETAGDQKQKLRPVDVVDAIYAGQSFSLGRPVGPQRHRSSRMVVEVSRPALLQPGEAQVSPDARQMAIACYPVTITARAAGAARGSTFVPKLTHAGRDLLADLLFEHSPDLPLGDTSKTNAANADTLEGWLTATRGGDRPFRQLTIYLPASGSAKSSFYELNGQPFQLSAAGVALLPGPQNPPGAKLRAKGKFALEIETPAVQAGAKLEIPLLVDLGSGWRGPEGSTLAVADGASALTIAAQSPLGERQVLRPSLPIPPEQADDWQLLAALVGGKTPPDPAIAYVVAIPRGGAGSDGQITLLARAANQAGTIALPAEASVSLEAMERATSASRRFTFALRAAKSGEYAGSLAQAPPGGYWASLVIGEHALPRIPWAIADNQTEGSAALLTYHNRCDYYRGEQVQAALVVRAKRDLRLDQAQLQLWLENSDQPLDVGAVSLQSPAGETRSLFVTLPTEGLPLGRHRLSLAAPRVVAYSLEFTLHSPTPRTNFALYSWMTGSFSGPARVGDETVANLLIDQKPSQFLRPDDIDRYTVQPNFPVALRTLLTRDALLPPAEKTDVYDAETEREMAIAMRMGLRYAPSYGWGLNSQEANWNPKHSLPEDLARMRRLCSLVAQRFRDFGNYAGLHLNWYPTYGGYWENHPATDGDAARRAEFLARQVNEFQLPAEPRPDPTPRLGPAADLELAVARHKFRVGALPRAYEAWTERATRLTPGITDRPLSSDVDQPGLASQRPLYSSFLPISWFDQQSYDPSVYFSTLPAATVHAYTDYGFSPFQHLWGLDFWAAGVGDKPKWLTTMSNGRDVMLPQALLAVARGADGIDINGDDPRAARLLSEFLTSYGPFFRSLARESDIAIVTSLRQQILHGKLVGKWMGYTGGAYFDLYTKLWYARRPADVLLEGEVTPERLKKYRAVFLVNQQAPLPEVGREALLEFANAGGKVFKDAATDASYPGETYQLEPGESIGPKWEGDKYVATRDQMFVGAHAAYEASATALQKLLAKLPPPRVSTDSHQTLVATLAGKELAVVMAVNDTRTPPGIYHPWNFWSATVLANEGKLSFDKPYVAYDLFQGGEVLRPEPDGAGRFALTVSFDRVAARPLVLLPAALRELRVSAREIASQSANDGRPMRRSLELDVRLIDERGETLADACPVEITLFDGGDQIEEQFYRAARPGQPISLALPCLPESSVWRVRVRELVSALVAEAEIAIEPATIPPAAIAPVLIPRRHETQAFFAAAKAQTGPAEEMLILLDSDQIAQQPELLPLAESLAQKLNAQGHRARVAMIDPLEIAVAPQRWRTTARDRQYLQEMAEGKRVVRAAALSTKYYQGERNRNEPDWLHPDSGYGEPSATYRVAAHVILLGNPTDNRFLADLRETIGMRLGAGFLSPGAAVAQVAWDAFLPGKNALCIEAADRAGLERGVEAVLALAREPRPPGEAPKVSAPPTRSAVKELQGFRPLPLPRYANAFGARVNPIAFTPDGGVLASADLQADNYFRFDAQGKLQQKWLGKHGLAPSASGEVLWASQWWGAPAYIDKVARCDANAQPQWIMDAPRFSRGFQHWTFPGRATLADRASDDLFVAGHCRLARLSAEGKTLWAYDDAPTAHDAYSFRFRRDLMLHDVSADGRLLLVAAFGIQPYGNFVSKFVRPALLLFDTHTGRLLWEKADILVDHAPCSFAPGKSGEILVGDQTPGRQRLLLLDQSGKQIWAIPRPEGASEAALTSTGKYAIVRPAAARNNLFQTIGEPSGLQILSLNDGALRELQTRGKVVSWKLLPRSSQVLVSTNTGLRVFAMDGALVWEQPFDGPVSFIVSEDERTFVVGSPEGKLVWLKWNGELEREVDLLPYNRVQDFERYAREYTRAPSEAPYIDPAPQAKPRIDARGNGVVAFSGNLLPGNPANAAREPYRLNSGERLYWIARLKPGATHVFSLTQRVAAMPRPGADRPSSAAMAPATGKLQATVRASGGKAPLLQVELPLTALWEERTFAWRAPATGGELEVELSIEWLGAKTDEKSASPATAVELRAAALFALTYPSANLLAQRVPAAPGELPSTNGNGRADALPAKTPPPSARYQIPNDVDLTALARGAPPFQRTVEFTTPFDGVLAGQKTSWLGKPLSGSTHATLEVKFEAPVALGSVAVYEDPTDSSHYTDTYAIFVREAKSGQMRQVGNVVGNRNPFNLFTFPRVEVDAITYLWLKSADGHARLMEMEAYLAEDDLLD